MSCETSEKKRAWLLPPPIKTKLSPGLYLIATPIGNLGDMTLRGLDTLAAVDRLLCEDTRVSGKLLKAYGLSKKMMAYNDHADDALRGKVVNFIQQGEAVGLISDAGTPLVSDPGYKLVQACRAAGVAVTALPGANAPLSALQLSGMPSDAFCFIGFLPPKSGARATVLQQWAAVPATLIAFETAPRLQKTLAALHALMPERKVAVVREITKLYEEARIDKIEPLLRHYEASGAPKGEIVLVIEPPVARHMQEADVRAALQQALTVMSTKEAAALIAAQTGWHKKDVYALALEVKRERE